LPVSVIDRPAASPAANKTMPLPNMEEPAD
jgi:hypothetical protein